MKRLEGGYMGNRPTFSLESNPGIWGIEQVFARRSAETWPAAIPFVNSGIAAPVLGATAATSTTGWFTLFDGGSDDNYYLTGEFGFAFRLNSVNYTNCFVSSNGYITFGSGSMTYSSISESNPYLPKILYAPGDRSSRRIFTKTGTQQSTKYFGIRWEGCDISSTVPPSTTFIEIYLYEIRASRQYVEVRFGNIATTGSVLLIASESTSYASASSAANTSYVFQGNADGNAWTLASNRYILT